MRGRGGTQEGYGYPSPSPYAYTSPSFTHPPTGLHVLPPHSYPANVLPFSRCSHPSLLPKQPPLPTNKNALISITHQLPNKDYLVLLPTPAFLPTRRSPPHTSGVQVDTFYLQFFSYLSNPRRGTKSSNLSSNNTYNILSHTLQKEDNKAPQQQKQTAPLHHIDTDKVVDCFQSGTFYYQKHKRRKKKTKSYKHLAFFNSSNNPFINSNNAQPTYLCNQRYAYTTSLSKPDYDTFEPYSTPIYKPLIAPKSLTNSNRLSSLIMDNSGSSNNNNNTQPGTILFQFPAPSYTPASAAPHHPHNDDINYNLHIRISNITSLCDDSTGSLRMSLPEVHTLISSIVPIQNIIWNVEEQYGHVVVLNVEARDKLHSQDKQHSIRFLKFNTVKSLVDSSRTKGTTYTFATDMLPPHVQPAHLLAWLDANFGSENCNFLSGKMLWNNSIVNPFKYACVVCDNRVVAEELILHGVYIMSESPRTEVIFRRAPNSSKHRFCYRIQGQPAYATETTIKNFFAIHANIVPESIDNVYIPRNKDSLENDNYCFVALVSKEAHEAAASILDQENDFEGHEVRVTDYSDTMDRKAKRDKEKKAYKQPSYAPYQLPAITNHPSNASSHSNASSNNNVTRNSIDRRDSHAQSMPAPATATHAFSNHSFNNFNIQLSRANLTGHPNQVTLQTHQATASTQHSAPPQAPIPTPPYMFPANRVNQGSPTQAPNPNGPIHPGYNAPPQGYSYPNTYARVASTPAPQGAPQYSGPTPNRTGPAPTYTGNTTSHGTAYSGPTTHANANSALNNNNAASNFTQEVLNRILGSIEEVKSQLREEITQLRTEFYKADATDADGATEQPADGDTGMEDAPTPPINAPDDKEGLTDVNNNNKKPKI